MSALRKIDLKIPLYYLLGGLLAWGIPYLASMLGRKSDDPWVNFADSLYDLLLIYYAVMAFLVLAVITSFYRWYTSTDVAKKNGYLAVFGITAVLLVWFLIETTGG
jgi:hypothetical protein